MENTAALQERTRIEQMFDLAESKRNYPGAYFPAKAKAQAALKAWQEKHPREAALEHARRLREEAGHLRDKARGALAYDADGWLSREDQQKRHNELMDQCQTKLSEAEKIEAENA
jgi:hypothetical protein